MREVCQVETKSSFGHLGEMSDLFSVGLISQQGNLANKLIRKSFPACWDGCNERKSFNRRDETIFLYKISDSLVLIFDPLW